jgi:hypothetical protein
MDNIFLPKVSREVNNIYAYTSAQSAQRHAGLPRFYFRQGKEMFLYFTASKPAEAHPASYRMGTGRGS